MHMKKIHFIFIFCFLPYSSAFPMHRITSFIFKHRKPLAVAAVCCAAFDVIPTVKYSCLHVATKNSSFINLAQNSPPLQKTVSKELEYRSYTQWRKEKK